MYDDMLQSHLRDPQRGLNTFVMGVTGNDAFDTAALRYLIREAAMSIFMESLYFLLVRIFYCFCKNLYFLLFMERILLFDG